MPDAAAPDPDGPCRDIAYDAWRDAPDDAAAEPAFDVASEHAAARAAGLRHLERLHRQRRRHPQRHDAGRRTLLEDARFCVIDLETTGTGAGGDDEILEIGAVQVTSGELGMELATLVDPERPITAASRAVHGIADADLAGAPRLAAALPLLLEMTRDRVLVFHNAAFDLGFLQRALAEHEREPFAQPVVDTLHASRVLLGGRCGLGTVGRRLGLDAPHLHRALPDARLTALVLLRCIELLASAGGAWLDELPGWTQRPQRPRRRRQRAGVRWLAFLEPAIRDGTVLEVVFRAARGVEPYTVRVRPLALRAGSQLVAEDLAQARPCILDLQRIDSLRPV